MEVEVFMHNEKYEVKIYEDLIESLYYNERQDVVDTTKDITSISARYMVTNVLYKWDILYYTGFAIFVAIGTFLIFLVSNLFPYEYNDYQFSPNYHITEIEQRDYIDSEEKLKAIINDPRIDKEILPEIGGVVAKDEQGFYIISKSEVKYVYYIHHLNSVPNYDYKKNYKFIPNVVTEFKTPVLAQKIETQKQLKELQNSKNIFIHKKYRLSEGSFIWQKNGNTYSVSHSKDVSQEHLVNPELNNIISACDLAPPQEKMSQKYPANSKNLLSDCNLAPVKKVS